VITVTRDQATRSGSVALSRHDVERTIALFVGELARRLETEPELQAPATESPAPSSPPVVATDEAAPRGVIASVDEAHARGRGMYGLVSMGGRLFARDGTIVATPRLEGGFLASPFRIGLTARYAYARATDPLGVAAVHGFTGGLAPSLVWGDLLTTGPRVELGVLSANGQGTRASSTSTFALSAGWELELHIPIGATFALVAMIEAGWMMQGIDARADDRSVLELAGPFGGVSAGALLLPAILR
jgi:hypothetical protein